MIATFQAQGNKINETLQLLISLMHIIILNNENIHKFDVHVKRNEQALHLHINSGHIYTSKNSIHIRCSFDTYIFLGLFYQI